MKSETQITKRENAGALSTVNLFEADADAKALRIFRKKILRYHF